MKVQCQCGAKYSIDATPEMAQNPVRFTCPGCGADLSGPINELIRQELGTTPAPTPGVISIPPAPPRPRADAPAAPAKLSIAHSASTATHGTPVERVPQAPATDTGQPCPKHRGQFIVEHCCVCQKPLCPKCMELFGYVCSPLCKARAESHGIHVPLYAGQKSIVEAKQSRKAGLIGGAVIAAVLGLVGFWLWYIFYGSLPHSVFSVRFPETAYAGSSQISGKNQIVFLHGGILARYDLSSKKPVWTNELITKQQLDDAVNRCEKAIQARVNEAHRWGTNIYVPAEADVAKLAQAQMEASLSLFVQDQNIWVAGNGKVTRYDWNTGKAGQQISVANSLYLPRMQGGELLFTDENPFGQYIITHLNIATGETHTEEVGEPVSSALLVAAAKSAASNGKKGSGGGLPTTAGGPDSGQPLDPEKVAEQAQNLSYAAKLALPATLANTMYEQQIEQELNSDDPDSKLKSVARAVNDAEYGRFFVNSKFGYIEWSSKMLEQHMVSRSVMKSPASRSALDGRTTTGNDAAAANETLNEIQRQRGGDVATSDESRYQVTIHRPEAKDAPDWVGEVIGAPAVFEENTVTIVTGGSMIIVLDRSNKKLWQTDLSHSFGEIRHFFEGQHENGISLGDGPCVERGDTLYVFDEATLTAFDLASGNVRWRVPSIGITGLFFDDHGSMYVNTTTADLESLRYSGQIDITKRINPSVLKIDCKTGKVLWDIQPGGLISHVEGDFVFCYAAHQAPDLDPDSPTTLPGMMNSFLDIKCLNPKDGKTVWDHVEDRAPLYVRFKGNTIEVVFRKELQVLKFISL